MADNTTLNAPTVAGGKVIASDDIGNIQFQRVKLISGVEGVNDGDIAESNPLPVIFPNQNFSQFGRLRSTAAVTIFDSKQIVDKQPLFWDDQIVSGSGGASTYNTNQASTTLSVSASTACQRVRQTFRRFNYQPGKSQLIYTTGILGDPVAGIIRRMGLFDANNGTFFESGTSAVSVVVRSNTSGTPVDTGITQANWNLDKLNGTGPSGVTADWSKVQLIGITFSWLGTGSVTFFAIINNQIIDVHRVDQGNSGLLVYMSTPNLPVRYEINNDGTGGAASLLHICASVATEDGVQTGTSRSISRGATPLVTLNDSSLYPVISIRLKSTHLVATIVNTYISVVCTTNSTFEWVVLLNPTVAGTALAFTGITNSSIEADLVSTNATTLTAATGTVLSSGISQQQNSSEGIIESSPSDLKLGSSIAGVADIMVLAVRRLTGTTETFYATLGYSELI